MPRAAKATVASRKLFIDISSSTVLRCCRSLIATRTGAVPRYRFYVVLRRKSVTQKPHQRANKGGNGIGLEQIGGGVDKPRPRTGATRPNNIKAGARPALTLLSNMETHKSGEDQYFPTTGPPQR